MLHTMSLMRGYHIFASDGEIGHVDDFLVDEKSWAIRYLVVDTSNWIGGQSVLISATSLHSIDSVNRRIHVKLSREEIKNSPSVEAADIDQYEKLPTIWII